MQWRGLIGSLLDRYHRVTLHALCWHIMFNCHARERQKIQFNEVRISPYPDFLTEVQINRARLAAVKQHLQKLQAPYVYPARLCITSRGQAYFFENTAEASEWINANEDTQKCTSGGCLSSLIGQEGLLVH